MGRRILTQPPRPTFPHSIMISSQWSVQIQFQLITQESDFDLDIRFLLHDLFNQSGHSKCSLPGCDARHTYLPLADYVAAQREYTTWLCSSQEQEHRPADSSDHEEVGEPKHENRFRHYRIALSSPNFPFTSSYGGRIPVNNVHHRPFFPPEWQVNRMLHILNFPPKSALKAGLAAIYTTPECRIRIRISCNPSQASYGDMHLQTFKNILEATAKYERLFDSIRPTSQIRRGAFDAQGWCMKVQTSTSWKELVSLSQATPPSFSTRLVDSPRCQGVDFLNPGTLDNGDVLCAIDVARCFFSYAEKTPYAEQAVGAWNAFIPNFSYDLLHLLRRIGVSKKSLNLCQAKLWAQREGLSYAEVIYLRSLNRLAPDHVLDGFLRGVAMAKRLETDRTSIEMVVNEKMRKGEYGWYPRGADIPRYSQLPVFDEVLGEGMLGRSASDVSNSAAQSSARHDSVVYSTERGWCSQLSQDPGGSMSTLPSSSDSTEGFRDTFSRYGSHTPSTSITSVYHDAPEYQQEAEQVAESDGLCVDESGEISWQLHSPERDALPRRGDRMLFRRWSVSLPLRVKP